MVHTKFSSDVNTLDSLFLNGYRSSETALEVNYAAQVTGWLLVQPTLQYYFNPGGIERRENALLLGVRTKVVF